LDKYLIICDIIYKDKATRIEVATEAESIEEVEDNWLKIVSENWKFDAIKLVDIKKSNAMSFVRKIGE